MAFLPFWTSLGILHFLPILAFSREHPNELFQEGVAGDGLLRAVVLLMNKLKENSQDYPVSMELCNLTSIYKTKGDRNYFDSYRGVFRTTSLRNIMDRLIYIDEYGTIDDNLTDCNVGSRKKRNIRDNLFVMNAIMNASKRGADEACDVSVYNVQKCFDNLWLSECINNIFEAGLTNDKLCLLYYSNKQARIGIKNPSGISDRMVIEDTVMQGTVWAGLMCTSTMDKLGKQAYQDPNLMYKYKNNVFVPPLEMVDDVICASKCGSQVVATNTAVTTFVKLKKLELGEKKCARMHVGRTNIQECSEIFVNGKNINESEKKVMFGGLSD